MEFVSRLDFKGVSQDSSIICLYRLSDFLTTPLRSVFQGKVYEVLYQNNSLIEVSQISQKTAHFAQRFFAFLTVIVVFPAVLLGLTIKLVLCCNSTVQKIWHQKSNNLRVLSIDLRAEDLIEQFNYCGEFLDHRPHGKGQLRNTKNQLMYEGDWQKDLMHGRGTLYQDGKRVYEGEWRNGKFDGQGIEYQLFSGEKFCEGEYRNGKLHGSGINYYSGGRRAYVGGYQNGKRHGSGVEYFSSGLKKYDGSWQVYYHGQGTLYDAQGYKTYVGQWQKGLRSGAGIEYDATGTVIHQGNWKEDTFQS